MVYIQVRVPSDNVRRFRGLDSRDRVERRAGPASDRRSFVWTDKRDHEARASYTQTTTMSLPSLQLPSLRSLELPTLRSLDLLPSIRTIQQDYSIGNDEEEDEGYDFSECKSSWFSESSERGRWLISPVKRRRTQEDVLPSSSPLMSLVSPMVSSSPLLPSSSPLMPSSPLLPSSPMMSSSPELSSSPMPPSSDDDLVPVCLPSCLRRRIAS